ncbi:MAG: M28 family peptidase [Planctomycetes bacterium]|nr:M28 family peptidase [Planctomycetota bacterium]
MRTRGWGVVAAALAAWCVLQAWGALAVLPPRPVPADEAGARSPSAERALARLMPEARTARPAGGDAGEPLRTRLLSELGALGLELAVQSGHVAERPDLPLVNLLARRRGTGDGSALLLVAHHDSVPRGEGAGDDGAGVAALLEALFVTRDDPPAVHDVIVLLTDGEEAGLLGARLFARDSARDSWFADVRAVVNVEGRGNGGPSTLFETGTGSGAFVRAFAAATPAAFGDALGPAVYRRMPNDTDFSIFRDAGLPGLNFAFFAGASVYHRASDTWDALSLRSLQHHAENLVGVLRGCTDLGTGASGADASRMTVVPGLGMILLPPWAGGALLLLGGLVLARRLGRRPSVGRAPLDTRSTPVPERAPSGTVGVVAAALGAALLEASLLAACVALAWASATGCSMLAASCLDVGVERGNVVSALLASVGAATLTWGARVACVGALRRPGLSADAATSGALALLLAFGVLAATTLPEAVLPLGAVLAAGALASECVRPRGTSPIGGGRLTAAALLVSGAVLVMLPLQHLLAWVGSVAPGGACVAGGAVGALAGLAAAPLREALPGSVRTRFAAAWLAAGALLLACSAVLDVRGL